MKRMLDKILVIDLEATCWEGDPPPGQSSEIIEIGLCVLDVATGARSEPQAILVRPQRSALSDYCIQLTTLTPEMLATFEQEPIELEPWDPMGSLAR